MNQTCDRCGKAAAHVRRTQFSGDFYFCEIHAPLERDFNRNNDHNFYWEKTASHSSAIECDHANEVVMHCSCSSDCYCWKNTCGSLNVRMELDRLTNHEQQSIDLVESRAEIVRLEQIIENAVKIFISQTEALSSLLLEVQQERIELAKENSSLKNEIKELENRHDSNCKCINCRVP